MTAEGILNNPFLFSEIQALEIQEIPYRRDIPDCINSHYDKEYLHSHMIRIVCIAKEYMNYCHLYDFQNCRMVRSHLMKLLYLFVSNYEVVREIVVKAHTLEEFETAFKVCLFVFLF